jgi:hypothetical protein
LLVALILFGLGVPAGQALNWWLLAVLWLAGE